MTGDLDITLTEDEVVAVAAILGSAWPTPFTLRSPVDADDARRVVERGALTLTVRGLVESEENGGLALGATLRRVTDAFTPGRHLAVYSGHVDQPGEPVTPIIYVHDSDQSITLVEAESGLGTRALSVSRRSTVMDQILASARSMFDGGGSAEALHVARVHDDLADVLTVSKGRITKSTVRGTGSETVSTSPFWDESRLGAMLDRTPATPSM